MEAEKFSQQEWERMARLFANDMLNDEGIALIEQRIDSDPSFRQIVVHELALYDEIQAIEEEKAIAMKQAIEVEAERIRIKYEQREAIERAKKGIRILGVEISKKSIQTVSKILLVAGCIAAIVFGFDYYNTRQDELARAKERERQLMAIEKKMLKDSLALAAKNPTSTSIGSNTQNIANSSQGQSFSSGVAKTNSGQSPDSIGSQQAVPVESGNADQTTFVVTVNNVPYQGGNSFSGDQRNRIITMVIYQIKTGKERYTLEGNKLTVYLSQENLNEITSGETKDLLVRKAAETLFYIRKDGKEILELEDGQVSPIK